VAEPDDLSAAVWSFRHAHRSGLGTDTLPAAKYFYLPVKTEEKIFGVLGVKPLKQYFTPEQINILDALSGLAALAITRLELAVESQKIITLEESERLRAALFNSISHDMKTPLASILGAVTSLVEDGDLYDINQKTTLLMSIRRGALRMNRVISNLLDMARLESGYMRLHTEWSDIQDIIGVTLRENREMLQDHLVKVEIPESIRLIRVDYALIEQVLPTSCTTRSRIPLPKARYWSEFWRNKINLWYRLSTRVKV
jgi:two-component system sensor histidine kinase KdpD